MRVIPHSGRELSLAMAIIFNTLAEDVHTTPQGSTATKGHTSHTCAKTETLSSHLAHVHKDRGFSQAHCSSSFYVQLTYV